MDDPVRREVTVDATPEIVWHALTQPEELAAWFGAAVEVDPRVGGAVRFRWPDGTERRGLIVEADPSRRLAFRWRTLPTSTSGTGSPEASVVTFTLETQGRGTRVTVTESPGVLSEDAPLAMAEHD